MKSLYLQGVTRDPELESVTEAARKMGMSGHPVKSCLPEVGWLYD
jgi:hypothetical protein